MFHHFPPLPRGNQWRLGFAMLCSLQLGVFLDGLFDLLKAIRREAKQSLYTTTQFAPKTLQKNWIKKSKLLLSDNFSISASEAAEICMLTTSCSMQQILDIHTDTHTHKYCTIMHMLYPWSNNTDSLLYSIHDWGFEGGTELRRSKFQCQTGALQCMQNHLASASGVHVSMNRSEWTIQTRWDKHIEIYIIWNNPQFGVPNKFWWVLSIIQPLGLDEVLMTSTEGQKHQLRSAQGQSPEGWRMKDNVRRDHIIQKSLATITNNKPKI